MFDDLDNFREIYFPWRADTPQNWEARRGKARCHQFANGPQPAAGYPICPDKTGEGKTP